jgi:hypothetical protein
MMVETGGRVGRGRESMEVGGGTLVVVIIVIVLCSNHHHLPSLTTTTVAIPPHCHADNVTCIFNVYTVVQKWVVLSLSRNGWATGV